MSDAKTRLAQRPTAQDQLLSPAQYRVLREHGSEPPYSSPLIGERRAGRFDCVGCGAALFVSTEKFDSDCGWPSFTRPLPNAITTCPDRSLGMSRTEIRCAGCQGHLGHVFADGPPPTGMRYCINGIVLRFVPSG